MDLQNDTPFVARLLRIRTSPVDFQATLVVKSTFELGAGGHLTPAAEQIGFFDKPFETPFGMFHSDRFVRKDGVDVCVLGTARPGRPVREAQVELAVGSERRRLQVFGDRTWRPSNLGLTPSDPAPFEEMPLGYTQAYGGATEHDYEKHVWPDNPAGRGYYLSEQAAVGHPLPNIELAEGPRIRTWSDQPLVAGWGPYAQFWGVRAREAVDVSKVDDKNPFPRVTARLYNNAHPSLVFPAIEKRARVSVRGMRPHAIDVMLPAFRPLAEISVGERKREAASHVDGVFLWVDAGKLTLTHRMHFGYEYRKGEKRVARLRDGGGK